MVDTSFKLFLELYFQEMTEQTFLTQKNKLFSIISKNHIKLKLSQTNKNNKIYNSKITTESTLYTLN